MSPDGIGLTQRTKSSSERPKKAEGPQWLVFKCPPKLQMRPDVSTSAARKQRDALSSDESPRGMAPLEHQNEGAVALGLLTALGLPVALGLPPP
eukprot:scaffold104738_cov33-Tisochrysis_lutea.AAC.3